MIVAGVHLTMPQLTERILASYARAGGINHLDGANLPSKTGIALIAADLLRLLFPGFFSEKPIQTSELKCITTGLLDLIQRRLQDEIRKSLDYCPPDGHKPGQEDKVARDLTLKFLAKLPSIRDLLQTDAEAAYNGDPAALSKDEVIVSYPFMEAISIQRMAHELYLQQVVLIPRIMTEWAHSRTGIDLHPGARIGSYFFIDHGTGTVIGETSEIGEHVKMYQGVGLVARSLAGGQALRGKKRHPTLEDNVTIYAGATIVGGETVVGAGSTIGANVFLTNSVPARSLVVFEGLTVRVTSKTARDEMFADYEI